MRHRFLTIQYLRGFAAMFVLASHALLYPLAGEHLEFSRLGWLGVILFFVISGFIMVVVTGERRFSATDFLRRRFIRVVPMYWLATLLAAGLAFVDPQAFKTTVYDGTQLLLSLAFVPFYNPASHGLHPLYKLGWTLNYEMFFYLIFGLFLLVRPTVRLWGTVAVLAVLVALGIVLGAPHLSAFGFYTAPVVLEFAAGMLLAEFSFRTGARGAMTRPVALLLIVAGLVVMLAMPYPLPANRVIAFGIPALAIVAGAVGAEERGGLADWRLPHLLGNASYSVYLTQLITMAAVFAAWKKLHLDQHHVLLPVFCLVDVGAALVGGLICYRLVERPLIALFGGPRRRRMADTAVSAEQAVPGQA